MTLFGSTRLYGSTIPVTPSLSAATNPLVANMGVLGPSGDKAQGYNSNDSWDLDELMKSDPKIAKLMEKHRKLALHNMP